MKTETALFAAGATLGLAGATGTVWLAVTAFIIFAVLLVCDFDTDRDPDIDIGPGYLQRWYVIPRNRWFNIYVHRFLQSDSDRALHDHPWRSVSVLLRGHIAEITPQGRRDIWRYVPVLRQATDAHRIELLSSEAWTLFVTGHRIRDWGFHCSDGKWIPWQEFTTGDKGERVGRGCGD